MIFRMWGFWGFGGFGVDTCGFFWCRMGAYEVYVVAVESLWWNIFMVGCFHKLLLPRFSVQSIAFNFFQKKKKKKKNLKVNSNKFGEHFLLILASLLDVLANGCPYHLWWCSKDNEKWKNGSWDEIIII